MKNNKIRNSTANHHPGEWNQAGGGGKGSKKERGAKKYVMLPLSAGLKQTSIEGRALPPPNDLTFEDRKKKVGGQEQGGNLEGAVDSSRIQLE